MNTYAVLYYYQGSWTWLGVYDAENPRQAVKKCRKVKRSDGFIGKGFFRTVLVGRDPWPIKDLYSPKKSAWDGGESRPPWGDGWDAGRDD